MNVSHCASRVGSGTTPARRSARCNSSILVAAFSLCLGTGPISAADSERIVVDTAAALQAAMVPENAGRRIVLKSGTYEVTSPLVVPDDATLQGRGVMLGDEYPTGIDPSGASIIVAAPGLVGDLITLGDGSRLIRLVIQQVEGSTGNAVVLGSRGPDDLVSATISRCEILNPNAPGIGPQGPTGRGVVVIARNPNVAADPPPHDGAELDLAMYRSVVRSPGGAMAIFGINFASDASVRMLLRNNSLGGGIEYIAGVSRGDYVQNSDTHVRSISNLYFAEEGFSPLFGVRVVGGSDAPVPMGWPYVTSNRAEFRSKSDVIEGFSIGLNAIGGNHFTEENNHPIGNSAYLRLNDLTLDSLDADFVIFGAYSLGEFTSGGEGNWVRVHGRGIQGSGAGPNLYEYAGPNVWGWFNSISFDGRWSTFAESNSNLNPLPDAALFNE